MSTELTGKTIAFLAADGVEDVELTSPRSTLQDAGATVVVVSLASGTIQSMEGDISPSRELAVDRVVADVAVDDFDALVLPGGTVNPDKLRIDETAVGFVRDFVASGKPVAAICHGPWTLVEAGVLEGRRVTSFPSIRTDLRNAGAGEVVDEEVVVDGNLITSRNPDDIPAFSKAIVEAVAAG